MTCDPTMCRRIRAESTLNGQSHAPADQDSHQHSVPASGRTAVGIGIAMLALATACAPATQVRHSPVWMPEATPNVFCEAMAHSDGVEFEPLPLGGKLIFTPKGGEHEALFRKLEFLIPILTARVQSPSPKLETADTKREPYALKAHGGQPSGGPGSSSPERSNRAGDLGLEARPVRAKVERTGSKSELTITTAHLEDVSATQQHLRRHVLYLNSGTCDWAQAPGVAQDSIDR